MQARLYWAMEVEKNNSNNVDLVVYRPSEEMHIDVRVSEETVWLAQSQMAILFGVKENTITYHIKEIYKTKELETILTTRKFRVVRTEGSRKISRWIDFYNLDMIISVGYRVNTTSGVMFRRWATNVLKDYMLRGSALNPYFQQVEQHLTKHDQEISVLNQRIDNMVKSALPPKCGLFFDGQIFDAYVLMAKLIKTAKKDIKLIDNYIDESVLVLLDKRNDNVAATIFTQNISPQLQLDIQRHNAQYHPIKARQMLGVHDRFMLIDDTQLYHIGASIKDLGKKLFAITLIEDTEIIAVMRKKIK